MAKVTTKQGLYGKCKVIEGYRGLKRLFVSKTSLKTWIVTESQKVSLDNMVSINGEYHFRTLKDLNKELAKG